MSSVPPRRPRRTARNSRTREGPRPLPRGLKPAALGTSGSSLGASNGHKSRVFTRRILRLGSKSGRASPPSPPPTRAPGRRRFAADTASPPRPARLHRSRARSPHPPQPTHPHLPTRPGVDAWTPVDGERWQMAGMRRRQGRHTVRLPSLGEEGSRRGRRGEGRRGRRGEGRAREARRGAGEGRARGGRDHPGARPPERGGTSAMPSAEEPMPCRAKGNRRPTERDRLRL